MKDITELCRTIGSLESSVATLFHNQDKLVNSIEGLNTLLRRRLWYDSAKIIGGAFAGGFTAILVKLGIWGV